MRCADLNVPYLYELVTLIVFVYERDEYLRTMISHCSETNIQSIYFNNVCIIYACIKFGYQRQHTILKRTLLYVKYFLLFFLFFGTCNRSTYSEYIIYAPPFYFLKIHNLIIFWLRKYLSYLFIKRFGFKCFPLAWFSFK